MLAKRATIWIALRRFRASDHDAGRAGSGWIDLVTVDEQGRRRATVGNRPRGS
jgi:hypothetical protein